MENVYEDKNVTISGGYNATNYIDDLFVGDNNLYAVLKDDDDVITLPETDKFYNKPDYEVYYFTNMPITDESKLWYINSTNIPLPIHYNVNINRIIKKISVENNVEIDIDDPMVLVVEQINIKTRIPYKTVKYSTDYNPYELSLDSQIPGIANTGYNPTSCTIEDHVEDIDLSLVKSIIEDRTGIGNKFLTSVKQHIEEAEHYGAEKVVIRIAHLIPVSEIIKNNRKLFLDKLDVLLVCDVNPSTFNYEVERPTITKGPITYGNDTIEIEIADNDREREIRYVRLGSIVVGIEVKKNLSLGKPYIKITKKRSGAIISNIVKEIEGEKTYEELGFYKTKDKAKTDGDLSKELEISKHKLDKDRQELEHKKLEIDKLKLELEKYKSKSEELKATNDRLRIDLENKKIDIDNKRVGVEDRKIDLEYEKLDAESKKIKLDTLKNKLDIVKELSKSVSDRVNDIKNSVDYINNVSKQSVLTNMEVNRRMYDMLSQTSRFVFDNAKNEIDYKNKITNLGIDAGKKLITYL